MFYTASITKSKQLEVILARISIFQVEIYPSIEIASLPLNHAAVVFVMETGEGQIQMDSAIWGMGIEQGYI